MRFPFLPWVRGRNERLSSAHLLIREAHNGLVLIVLVNPNIAQRLTHVRVVEYILECHSVMGLLVHVVSECLPQCMCAYGA